MPNSLHHSAYIYNRVYYFRFKANLKMGMSTRIEIPSAVETYQNSLFQKPCQSCTITLKQGRLLVESHTKQATVNIVHDYDHEITAASYDRKMSRYWTTTFRYRFNKEGTQYTIVIVKQLLLYHPLRVQTHHTNKGGFL